MSSTKFNYKLLFKIHGGLLVIECVFLLIAFLVGLYHKEEVAYTFIIASIIAFVLGISGLIVGKNAQYKAGKRESSVIVTSIWVLFSLIGMIPYWISNNIPNFTNAFFETISGFTATGATILHDIESLPFCMLFWRSFTQWIGGLGIVVITMAIFSLSGFSGIQLFAAEMSGPTKDKIHPKISEMAKRLLLVYFAITFLAMVSLKIAGMGWFDAVCHAFSTAATGGFSTKQASILHWNSSAIEYITAFFLIFSGVNLSLYYFLFKLNFNKVFKNEELRFYLISIVVFTVILLVSFIDFTQPFTWSDFESNFRKSFFSVSSILTSTSYAAYDYMQWKPFLWIVILIMMISGACAGSTTGGIKMVRIVLVLKFCYYEFKHMIHPNAVFPIRYNGHMVKADVITRLLVYVLLYCILLLFGTLVLSFSGMGFMESISAMISSLSNIGSGLGTLGPEGNWDYLPVFSKWFIAFMMLVGRLEIFTVLLILTPAFWKK